MKKSLFIKLLSLMICLVMAVGVFACNPDPVDPPAPPTPPTVETALPVIASDSTSGNPILNEAATSGVEIGDPFEATDLVTDGIKGDVTQAVTLRMAVFHDSNSYITYNQSATYNAANGIEYKSGQGQIKPVWKELSDRLNFSITDVTANAGYGNQTAQWTALSAGNHAGYDIVTGNAADIVQEATLNGTFVDLAKYINEGKMPHLKAFMEGNDIIQKSVYTGDKMYYAPYFDGNDDLERMFMLRVDWVEKLLDVEDANYDNVRDAADATKTKANTTIATSYKPFMPEKMNRTFNIVKADGSAMTTATKKYEQNIITAQNALTEKNGKALTEALIEYLDSTYDIGGAGSPFAKRSEIFVGQNAIYDCDELVALMRCVKANPVYLTTGSGVVLGDNITNMIPFYPRNHTADRVMDLLRLMEIWGVRGFDGRNNFFFIDENGELQDARITPNTMHGLERLNMLYKEGLVLRNFNSESATSGSSYTGDATHRGRLNKQNRGFMTYDYNQTTTVVNNLDSEITGFNLTPVLPPFTDWGYKLDDGTVSFVRFTDSWRSVKPNGWAIRSTLTGAALDRAITLFDYLYSKTGNRLMSYGPEEWIDQNETIEYNGRQVPKLAAVALQELQTYASGNYTNYYRRFLGGTFPIGYIKEQGMEYQCVHQKGQVGLDYILKAIQLGGVKRLVLNSEDAGGDNRLLTVPTVLPLTEQDQSYVKNNCAVLANNFNTQSSNGSGGTSFMAFYDIILSGYVSSASYPTKQSAMDIWFVSGTGMNCGNFLKIHQDAYKTL